MTDDLHPPQWFRDDLQKYQTRSVSFDLHGTLIYPELLMEEVVFQHFSRALQKRGISLVKDISDIVSDQQQEGERWKELSHDTKVLFQQCLEENPDHDPQKIGIAFVKKASAQAKYHLAKGDFGDNFYDLGPSDQLATRMALVNLWVLDYHLQYRQRVEKRTLHEIGKEIHANISEDDTRNWIANKGAQGTIAYVKALNPPPILSIFSNASEEVVTASLAQYFPNIFDPWMIFTPTLLNYGKPDARAFIGLLVGVSCGLVRSAFEGRANDDVLRQAIVANPPYLPEEQWRRDWMKARQQAIAVAQNTLKSDNGLLTMTALHAGIDYFLKAMKLNGNLSRKILVEPSQHFHLGNSHIQDACPHLSLDALLPAGVTTSHHQKNPPHNHPKAHPKDPLDTLDYLIAINRFSLSLRTIKK